MIKVLWISRHEMTFDQLADLESVLGDRIELTYYKDTLNSVSDIAELIYAADAVAAVLPAEKMSQVMDLCSNKPLLQSVSERVPTENYKTLDDGRTEQEFRFVHCYWEYIEEIRIRTKKCNSSLNFI